MNSKTQSNTPTQSTPTQEALPMEMDVRIHSLRTDGSVLANASVTLNGCFAVRGVKVMNGSNGPFVSMPSYKDRDGYKDICFPCTKEFRQQFQQTVLGTYQQALTQLPQQQENGAPNETQRSGFVGERRSSEVSESCRLRQDEGYGACDDAAPPAPQMTM